MRQPISVEFCGAKLGDRRRSKRLLWLAETVMAAPDAGFPRATSTASELEGVYRFLRNEQVKPKQVLAPHIRATVERVKAAGPCLVVHDTTEVTVGGKSKRAGLGPTSSKAQGFFAHTALAVLPGESRVPLGVLDLRHWARTEHKGGRGRHSRDKREDSERESLRWPAMLETVHVRCAGAEVVHVMDREADIYEVIAKAQELGARFVIRSSQDRATDDDDDIVRLRAAVEQLEPRVFRKIFISKRPETCMTRSAKTHPPRNAREVEVAMAARTVTVLRPQGCRTGPAAIELNVVRVWEPSPAENEPPVEWVLLTTEAIDTDEDIERVVDTYRSRWVIEEFFKTLKQGCSLEKRQLESYHALSNALAVFLPVAWRLLLMRSLVREAPELPARAVLTPIQLQLLQLKLKLPSLPQTVQEALYAVARVGGHLRNNGLPGWQTLGRGYFKLLDYEIGFQFAQALLRSDQS